MQIQECRAFVAQLIPAIERHLLGGGRLTYAGMPFTTVVKVEPDGLSVNAMLYMDSSRWGVEVSDLMLSGFVPDDAIKFGIAHELGHAFGGPLLDSLCIAPSATVLKPGVTMGDDAEMRSGAPTEVIADLGAAYILNLMGMSWEAIIATADQGNQNIFDTAWNGDHPPAAMRADCIRSFVELLRWGGSFENSAKAVCLSMVGTRPLAGAH
ncbi:MAG: hypothetical protein ABW023_03710 [Sphingomonas sp.]